MAPEMFWYWGLLVESKATKFLPVELVISRIGFWSINENELLYDKIIYLFADDDKYSVVLLVLLYIIN